MSYVICSAISTWRNAPHRGEAALVRREIEFGAKKQHCPVVSSGFSANHTKLLFLQGTCQLDTRWLRPDWPRTIRRGQYEEGKCPETMQNSNLFRRTKMRVFSRCTHSNLRFLKHISSFLKPTAMKRLGIAHSTILDIAMKTQACGNYQERRSILVPADNWREKNSKSPICVFFPLCSAALVLPTNLRLHHKIKDYDVGIS